MHVMSIIVVILNGKVKLQDDVNNDQIAWWTIGLDMQNYPIDLFIVIR